MPRSLPAADPVFFWPPAAIGTLFAAYPATGSFSRSALKSKSGVRTPAAGWWTGIIVIIALYALTDAFYFVRHSVAIGQRAPTDRANHLQIPNASLSAIIIGAVVECVAPALPRPSFPARMTDILLPPAALSSHPAAPLASGASRRSSASSLSPRSLSPSSRPSVRPDPIPRPSRPQC
jgi:hypothetical protein